MAPDPIIPENQQDSFPIQTVAQATAPDQTLVQGGQVQKYWGPGTTGISATAVTVDGGTAHRYCVSNYLDMTGCSNGAALVMRVNTVGAPPPACNPMLVRFQYRLNKATTMPTSGAIGGAPGLLASGIMPLQTGAGFVFAAMPVGVTIEYGLFTWGPSAINSGLNLSPVTIGSDVRIFLSFAAAIAPPGADDLFSLAVWGSS